MEESCGVFGILSDRKSVSQLTYDGLYALQHRGQESAGIAVSDGDSITVYKDMGLVAAVFDEITLATLQGNLAIGHTRYSTTGSSTWRNAQPVYRSHSSGGFAIAHNGNLTNTEILARESNMLPGTAVSDSDVLAETILAELDKFSGASLKSALLNVLPKVEGAYSLVMMDKDHIMACRDPKGLRPLCYGQLVENDEIAGHVFASETAALDVIGAQFVREVEPGELLVIGQNYVESLNVFPSSEIEARLCIFEFVYFSRPDSILYGQEVHESRRRMGERLAVEHPVDADMVMGVPDSGVPAAEGFALKSRIPYGQGLVKNRYIGRTFIDPSAEARARAVRRKLNPLKENIRGKRLVVVDDSFVRGTTSSALVKMLRDAGATEVHMRFSSPPFVWPCYYGIDIPDRTELLAANVSLDKIAEIIGADSVGFLSLEGLRRATCATGVGFCDGCLTGNYPTQVDIQQKLTVC